MPHPRGQPGEEDEPDDDDGGGGGGGGDDDDHRDDEDVNKVTAMWGSLRKETRRRETMLDYTRL